MNCKENSTKNPGGAQEEKLCQHDVDEDDEEDTLQMAIALSLQEEGGKMDKQKKKKIKKLNDSYQTNFQMANRKGGSLSRMTIMMRRRC